MQDHLKEKKDICTRQCTCLENARLAAGPEQCLVKSSKGVVHHTCCVPQVSLRAAVAGVATCPTFLKTTTTFGNHFTLVVNWRQHMLKVLALSHGDKVLLG